MKRIIASVVIALLAAGASTALLPAVAGAAPSQDGSCFPGSGVDYPPTTGDVTLEPVVLVSGQFNPGGSGNVVISGMVSGDVYCGTLYSSPVPLPAKAANAQGTFTQNVSIPSNFELNALHHIDVFKRQTLVGAFDFCVSTTGAITAMSTCGKASADGGDLPKTGTNHLMDIVRIALIILAFGAIILYVRRRQQERHRTV